MAQETKHWTGEATSYRPSDTSKTWALVYDAIPGGRKNEDGTTSYSMRIPALIVSEYVADPESVATEFAEKLNVFPKLVEALKAAGNSAGFQYMTTETRAMIDDALASAGAE